MAKLKRTVIVGGLSGSSGPVTFKLTSEGTIVSERTSPANPGTAAQQAARGRFTTAATTYRGLTAAQVEAWDAYAQSHVEHDPVTGTRKFADGINAYIGLATKWLQANTTGTPPATPPATGFTPPDITMTAAGGTGKVTFTASAATPLGVKAELLVQRLSGANRKPQKGGYRSKAIVAFTAGGLSQDVTVSSGYWAAAYRFVNTATGQASDLQEIGVQTVSLSLGGTAGKKAA
ncbi:MAG: hypothetical protein KF857_11040 [Fimbriimonadaceae bacterium]|nr:hypothetical protein [Fimbriimonadaceae bacterium]